MNDELHWMVENRMGVSFFYCPECYKAMGKKIFIRKPITHLAKDQQCPECSIEVQKWVEGVEQEK